MTSKLRFVGLGKYGLLFFFLRHWELSRKAGRKSDCGPCLRGWHRPKERRKTTRQPVCQAFCRVFQLSRFFWKTEEKKEHKGQKGLVSSWIQKCWWVDLPIGFVFLRRDKGRGCTWPELLAGRAVSPGPCADTVDRATGGAKSLCAAVSLKSGRSLLCRDF